MAMQEANYGTDQRVELYWDEDVILIMMPTEEHLIECVTKVIRRVQYTRNIPSLGDFVVEFPAIKARL